MRLPQWKAVAFRLLDWWWTEFKYFVPVRLQEALTRQHDADVVIELGREHIRYLPRGTAGTDPEPPMLPIESEALLSAIGQLNGTPTARIVLHPDVVLQLHVELPEAAEPELKNILRHQLPRLTPMRADEVEIAWEIANRLGDRKSILVYVVIAKSATLRLAKALGQRAGLHLKDVIIRFPGAKDRTIFSDMNTQNDSILQKRARQILDITCVALFVASYWTYINHLDRSAVELTQSIDAMEQRLMPVKLAIERSKIADPQTRRIEASLLSVSSVDILSALTEALPLSSSLSELHVQNSRIDISGTAEHATLLLQALDGSNLFENAVFVAPITAAPGQVGEHFEINAKIRARSTR